MDVANIVVYSAEGTGGEPVATTEFFFIVALDDSPPCLIKILTFLAIFRVRCAIS